MSTTISKSDEKKVSLLEGRVANIISYRELAINIGLERGVEKGMYFAVLAEKPIEVLDPGTNELLDTIEREKIRVRAVEVRPKITICKTFSNSIASNYASTLGGLYEKIAGDPKTFKHEDSEHSEPLAEDDSYVKINDRVVQISEDAI